VKFIAQKARGVLTIQNITFRCWHWNWTGQNSDDSEQWCHRVSAQAHSGLLILCFLISSLHQFITFPTNLITH